VILKFSDAKLENIFQCHNDKNDWFSVCYTKYIKVHWSLLKFSEVHQSTLAKIWLT